MNKKLMAIAVAGALGVPAAAFAQASNYQIYGRLHTGLDNWEATGATAGNGANDFKPRNRVYDNGSRIGIRGTEDLGGGMRALFVIESGASIDSGSANGQNGLANASGGTLASRDSYVGLGGNWGDVRFGRQSIYWVEGTISQFSANYINQELSWLNGANLGRVAGPSARVSNVVSYNSPTVGGFNGTFSYAPNSETTQATGTGVYTNAVISGLTLRYNGVVNAQLDLGSNTAATPATGTTGQQKVTGTKVGLAYPYMPGAQVSMVYINGKNANVNAGQAGFTNAGDTVKTSSWNLIWEQTFGNIQALAEYGRVANATGCSATATNGTGANGCDDSGSKGYVLGVRYLLSKRTAVYTSYIKLENSANGTADASGGAYSSVSSVAGIGNGSLPNASAGADVKIVAIGILHNF
jgi:GBP family porin